MPLTPLHYAVAYAVRKAGKKAGLDLDMPSLAVGSFTPDLEALILIIIDRLGYLPSDAPYAQCHRLVLHSIFGSLTVGSLITMLVVMAPEGMEMPGLKDLYVASALGNLSHVLLDAVHHTYNPLLFPFTTANVLALVPLQALPPWAWPSPIGSSMWPGSRGAAGASSSAACSSTRSWSQPTYT